MTTKDGTRLIINQIIATLNLLDNSAYTQKIDVFEGSTLGQHFRHILDFYNCIFLGGTEGEINYSRRERNPSIEQEVSSAIRAFEKLLPVLRDLEESNTLDVVPDFHHAQSREKQVVRSSAGRELMYAYDHAIHHLAMIKIGIQTHFPSIKVDQNLGVAPSTIRHRMNNPAEN